MRCAHSDRRSRKRVETLDVIRFEKPVVRVLETSTRVSHPSSAKTHALGVDERTIRRWTKLPGFATELEKARARHERELERAKERERKRRSLSLIYAARASSGSSTPASSLRTLFTRAEAGRASMRSAGYGPSRDRACSLEIDGSSQTASASVGRITGIRSCTGATSSFGRVVMIVQLSVTSPVSSSIRDVHRRRTRTARSPGGGSESAASSRRFRPSTRRSHRRG
jgi:hypothetical protein